jgi:hypothetical protein
MSISATSTGHGDKESMGRVAQGKQRHARYKGKEQDKGGRRRLQVHSSHSKEWTSLRPRAVASRTGAFSFPGCLGQSGSCGAQPCRWQVLGCAATPRPGVLGCSERQGWKASPC